MDSIEHPVFFSEWFKSRRKALDLTQSELAQRAGCSVSALRKIESGERRPSKQLASLLAKSLEIPSEDQKTFVRVARGELNLERLPPSSRLHLPSHTLGQVTRTDFTNLPISPTPLIGREPELEALSGLLKDRQCRLLTLIGPGGIGKTHLAIEAASQHLELFPEGACFVSLAALSSSAYLVPAIADALGFMFQGHIEPRIQLLSYLRTKQALLLLDNAEHLLDGVGLFAEILEWAPGVKLLITSRERLNLQGEWVFEIQGLPVPPSDQIGRAEEYSAVALFVQSAQRAQIGFELRSEETPSVVHICQLVEGMPLGIQLAAAWVSVLTCGEIAKEIERSLDFLATTMREVPARQRSLRATFDHSWSLLTPEERVVLSRLAIFQGGFERQVAEQVAGATLSSLQALVSKSLVHRMKSGRYDLHEVVRQYALSQLADDPHHEATHDQHCDFYLALLRDREKALQSGAQRLALRELTDEIGNLRVAWTWAVEGEKFLPIRHALRCFAWLYEMQGWFREGIEQLELVVQVLQTKSSSESQSEVLGQALAQQGLLLFRQGQYYRALTLFEESLTILRPFNDPALLLDALVFSGIIMFLIGEFARSQVLLDECLQCARAAGDQWFEAYALYCIGSNANYLGRYAYGYDQMLTGIAMWRSLGDGRYTALGLNWISPTAIKLGHYEQANAFLQESLTLCKQVGDRWGIGTAFRHMGLLALAQGDHSKAQSMIQKSLDTFSGFITGWDVVRSLVYLGEAVAAAGDIVEARRIFHNSLHQAMEAQAPSLAMDVLIGLAELQAQVDEAEQVFGLSIYVLNQTVSTQETKDRAALLSTTAKQHLTPVQIKAIEQKMIGQSLNKVVEKLLAEELI
jgi:predicted ATPase/transcriptional regulator with XRE-family HTH domain